MFVVRSCDPKIILRGLRSGPLVFCSGPAVTPVQTETPMEEVHRYRGHTIRFTVQRNSTTLYWRARGTIEYTEAGRFWTFIMTGAIDTFTTEGEAKDGFIQQAKKWVDDRLGS